MCFRTLAIAALALLASPLAAQDYQPGTQVRMEGKVVAFQNARSFWLEVGDKRVLVYGTQAQRERLFPGLRLHVEGRVSDDFIKLAEVEVEAREIRFARNGQVVMR